MTFLKGVQMKRQINVQIESDMLREFDLIRGMITRSVYLRKMIDNEITAANGSHLHDRTVCGMLRNRQDGESADV